MTDRFRTIVKPTRAVSISIVFYCLSVMAYLFYPKKFSTSEFWANDTGPSRVSIIIDEWGLSYHGYPWVSIAVVSSPTPSALTPIQFQHALDYKTQFAPNRQYHGLRYDRVQFYRFIPQHFAPAIVKATGATGSLIVLALSSCLVAWAFVAHSVKRLPQGACPACGYQMEGLERCPECGAMRRH